MMRYMYPKNTLYIYNISMHIKQELLNKYQIIIKSKKIVKTLDPNYIICKTFNHRELDNNTISIVMTTYNRPIQTLFTIKTIAHSTYKNIQVILVDDHPKNQFTDQDLQSYGIHIDYIKIKDKFWINPCVNYNIGFKYIKGGKIIIQNAEVCHVDDVIKYVNDNLKDQMYFSFDILSLKNIHHNNIMYVKKSTSYKDLYAVRYNNLFWYQHSKTNNKNLHFLTAMTKKSFDLIKGFDFDFCLGTCWDDDALLYKIKINNIKIVTIDNEKERIMGIHQWHSQTPSGYRYKINNSRLFKAKIKYYNKHKKYIDLTEDNIPENIVNRINSIF